MYHDFIINMIVVLFFCGIIMWIDLSLHKKFSHYILGAMFGLITIFLMQSHIMIGDRFYDFRHIAMTMAGFIGGPITAAIAAIISSIYRYNVGGSGSMGGIINIIIFACFGSILGRRLRSNQTGKKVLFWFTVGIAMTCILLFIIAFIPPWKTGSFDVLRIVTVPYLILTPLVTTILFNFYFSIYNFLGKASILNAILNCSPINLMISDANGPILVSKNIKTQHQFPQNIEEFFHLQGDTQKSWLNRSEQQRREIATEDGRNFTADLSNFQMPNGEYACVAIVTDITELKQMQKEGIEHLTKHLKLEEDLSRSNQLIADIINTMQDGFYALDNHWRFTFVNKKAEELFQKTQEELLGKVCWDIISHARASILEPNFQKAKHDCLPITFEFLSPLNKETWYQVTAYPSQFGLSVYYRDVTERKLEREILKKSQAEMASILESMTDGFVALDENKQFTYINRAGEIAFGKSRDELLGKKITEIYQVSPIAIQHYYDVLREKRSVTFEIISEALDNKWLEISAYPTENGVTCYFRDITSRKIAQEEIARLDRLNLVGQFAAGIGHEIRNPMTTVRGYLQLLGERPINSALKPTFELMISELDRANSIITEFLSLAQTRHTELKSQNLNDIIYHLYPLIEADTFTQNKQFRFIPGEIPSLALNAKEISQLILNLTRNGLEAMKENGCLTIESFLQDGKVVLAIEDEGCGIPPENNNKLGTPFFTTKDYGTGLGLATCYKIAESHDAKICVDSNPTGTTFYISFPVRIDNK